VQAQHLPPEVEVVVEHHPYDIFVLVPGLFHVLILDLVVLEHLQKTGVFGPLADEDVHFPHDAHLRLLEGVGLDPVEGVG
jgi:hypothetical protein